MGRHPGSGTVTIRQYGVPTELQCIVQVFDSVVAQAVTRCCREPPLHGFVGPRVRLEVEIELFHSQNLGEEMANAKVPEDPMHVFREVVG